MPTQNRFSQPVGDSKWHHTLQYTLYVTVNTNKKWTLACKLRSCFFCFELSPDLPQWNVQSTQSVLVSKVNSAEHRKSILLMEQSILWCGGDHRRSVNATADQSAYSRQKQCATRVLVGRLGGGRSCHTIQYTQRVIALPAGGLPSFQSKQFQSKNIQQKSAHPILSAKLSSGWSDLHVDDGNYL
jgi:hypothetical protein